MSNSVVKRMTFAAIDPYLETQVVSPKETNLPGKNRVEWGDRNQYPQYVWDLYKTTPTLQTIVNGSVDFVIGDDVQATRRLGDGSARNFVRDLAQDTFLYGGRCYQIIRSRAGLPVEAYHIPMPYIRTDKDNEVFYYSEKWDKGARDCVVYPKFYPFTPEEWALLDDDEKNRHASSILFVKNTNAQAYPIAPVGAAVKSCEIERGISDYHLNALENSFTGSLMVNFNAGTPTPEMQREIEDDFSEKFGGHQNGGRMVFSWNESRDTATTITPIKVEDFGARYDALAKFSREQIFCAFRAVPAIFGLMTESTGFSEQEFTEAFRLYNRTAIKPVQRDIADELVRIFGEEVITITPFNIEAADTNVE